MHRRGRSARAPYRSAPRGSGSAGLGRAPRPLAVLSSPVRQRSPVAAPRRCETPAKEVEEEVEDETDEAMPRRPPAGSPLRASGLLPLPAEGARNIERNVASPLWRGGGSPKTPSRGASRGGAALAVEEDVVASLDDEWADEIPEDLASGSFVREHT